MEKRDFLQLLGGSLSPALVSLEVATENKCEIAPLLSGLMKLKPLTLDGVALAEDNFESVGNMVSLVSLSWSIKYYEDDDATDKNVFTSMV